MRKRHKKFSINRLKYIRGISKRINLLCMAFFGKTEIPIRLFISMSIEACPPSFLSEANPPTTPASRAEVPRQILMTPYKSKKARSIKVELIKTARVYFVAHNLLCRSKIRILFTLFLCVPCTGSTLCFYP
jgi:hypothetical protein